MATNNFHVNFDNDRICHTLMLCLAKNQLQRGLAMNTHEQMNLFTQRLLSAHLVAQNSPRKAFYRIWVESTFDDVRIVKESGIKNKMLDRRSWPAESVEAATDIFRKKIASKTNPNRKSPRKYTLISLRQDAVNNSAAKRAG